MASEWPADDDLNQDYTIVAEQTYTGLAPDMLRICRDILQQLSNKEQKNYS